MFGSRSEYKGGMVSDSPLELTLHDEDGRRSTASVVPQRIWFGCTDRFRDTQWLVEAFDLDRHTMLTLPLTAVTFSNTAQRVPDGQPDPSPAGRVRLHG